MQLLLFAAFAPCHAAWQLAFFSKPGPCVRVILLAGYLDDRKQLIR